MRLVNTKCSSGKPPCLAGETEERCHLFHCSNGCTEMRGENKSCLHGCGYCQDPLLHEGSIVNLESLEEKGIELSFGFVHYRCWEAIHELPPKARQSLLEEFF